MTTFSGVRLLFTLPLAWIAQEAFAQNLLTTQIVHGSAQEPAAFASVKLKQGGMGTTADAQGRVKLRIPQRLLRDTLLITGIGLNAYRVPVKQALQEKRIWISDSTTSMNSVVVSAKRVKSILGAFEESAAYMRSWNTLGSGGEIGRIFDMPSKPYFIERVSFKVNTQCDTCLIRLRIRKMNYQLPGSEILEDSLVTWVYRQSHDDPNPYFDLTDHPLEYQEKRLFVALEVIECRKQGIPGACSLSFVGTEHGSYWYKMHPKAEWEGFHDYGIYMKLYLNHEEEQVKP
jgi:hypothetical protein